MTPEPPPVPVRQRCACRPSDQKGVRRAWPLCPACLAWEQGDVLLVDGSAMARLAWVQYWQPTPEGMAVVPEALPEGTP